MPYVDLDTAVALLRGGALVAIPTETVYGLAADGLSPAAVARIFALKGRPPTHPLILHVVDDPSPFAEVDDRARALISALWPGPLTLVLRRKPVVPDAVTGGRDTVAVRSPAHPLARAVLARLGRPLAAPSANRFGRVSPTTAAHVLAEFPDLPVLDGGRCDVGVESTIVDLSGPQPALLRPGGVPIEAITAHIGPLATTSSTAAPGTLPAHYAPRTPVLPSHAPAHDAARLIAAGKKVVVIHASEASDYAWRLYDALREADAAQVDCVVIEWAEPRGLGAAINDRIQRAAAGAPWSGDAQSIPDVP